VREVAFDPVDDKAELLPRDVVELAPEEPGRLELPVVLDELNPLVPLVPLPAVPLVPRPLLPLVPLMPLLLVPEEPLAPVVSLPLVPLVPLVPKAELEPLRVELPLLPSELDELPWSDELPELIEEDEPCEPATCSSC
jgi:hypothetical protein